MTFHIPIVAGGITVSERELVGFVGVDAAGGPLGGIVTVRRNDRAGGIAQYAVPAGQSVAIDPFPATALVAGALVHAVIRQRECE